MERIYFNHWEFQQALAISRKDPLFAKDKFRQYLNKYPKDYSAYPYYAYLLIILSEFEEAEKVLKFAEIQAHRNSQFVSNSEKLKTFEYNVLFNRLRILTYQERFDELYEHYHNYLKNNDAKNINFGAIDFYSKRKLGQLDLERREEHSYLFRQIIQYQEEDFLIRVHKHSAEYNENTDTPDDSIFVPDFPAQEVIEEVKKYIPSSKKLCCGFFEDIYIFKYDGNGRYHHKLVDYFKVVCFHNTKDFITMCPKDGVKNFPYVDLNYLTHTDKDTKVKRLSQIDKFNQKYHSH